MFLGQPPQPVTPVIVRMVEQPAREISVADVLLGAVGITGLFLAGAAILGILLGGVFILFRRMRAASGQHDHAQDPFRLTRPPDSER